MTLEAFKHEILPLKANLYRYVLSIVHREELAKDICQEVFLKVWQKKEMMDRVKNKEAWCIRCARNLSLDKLKAHSNRVQQLTTKLDPADDHQRLDHQVEAKDLLDQIKLLLNDLPEKQREIFRLRDLAGYSNQEIAGILDLDPGQVKVNLCRARQKIKTALKQKVEYGISER